MGPTACLMMDDMVPHHAVATGPLNSGVVLRAYLRDEAGAPIAEAPNLTRRQVRELAEKIAASMGMLPIMQDPRLERRQDRFEKNLTENRGDKAGAQEISPKEPNP